MAAKEIIIADFSDDAEDPHVDIREKDGTRRGSITVSLDQLKCIVYALRHKPFPYPNAYEAWMDMMGTLGVVLDMFLINALIGDGDQACVTGILCCHVAGSRFSIPCGMVEGMNLALRTGAPVLCDDAILTRFHQRYRAVSMTDDEAMNIISVDPPLTKN